MYVYTKINTQITLLNVQLGWAENRHRKHSKLPIAATLAQRNTESSTLFETPSMLAVKNSIKKHIVERNPQSRSTQPPNHIPNLHIFTSNLETYTNTYLQKIYADPDIAHDQHHSREYSLVYIIKQIKNKYIHTETKLYTRARDDETLKIGRNHLIISTIQEKTQ